MSVSRETLGIRDNRILATPQEPQFKVTAPEAPQATLAFTDRIGGQIPFSRPAGHSARIQSPKELCGLRGSQETFKRRNAAIRIGHSFPRLKCSRGGFRLRGLVSG